jgi:hypothetical protein
MNVISVHLTPLIRIKLYLAHSSAIPPINLIVAFSLHAMLSLILQLVPRRNLLLLESSAKNVRDKNGLNTPNHSHATHDHKFRHLIYFNSLI